MRKIYLILLPFISCIFVVYAGNPLTGKLRTPNGTIPYNKIKNSDYIPAFEDAIDAQQKEIREIIENPDAPSFENTILALEYSGKLLARVKGAFFGILDTDNTDEKMEISKIVTSMLSENEHYIYLNDTLFNRVKTLYDKIYDLNLLTEDERLLQKIYNRFCDKGANLSPQDKEKYKELKNKLNLYEIRFNQNILKDENNFGILITDKKNTKGFPDDILSVAANAANAKGKNGWYFTLSEASYVPFMTYMPNRTFREKMYRAKMNVGNNKDEYDNNKIVKDIVNARLEIAKLMNYDNYAEYILKNQMAENKDNVYELLRNLLNNYMPLAQTEFNIMQGYVLGYENIDSIQLMPWDWDYYSDKLKNLYYKVNDEMTRPYFELENVRQNIFNLATDLFGLTFIENPKIPVYAEEVKAYEVYDEKENFTAILYMDFFPRPTKASGGWMMNIQEQYIDKKGKDHRPHILIAMNFNTPTDTEPSLLTYNDVRTLLHEFGHALHGMLSRCKYASQSGVNVQQDFSELPSQIMENWINNEDFLNRMARHYQTGEKIPKEFISNLVNAANFQIGYNCCKQIGYSYIDMAWHTITQPFDGNIKEFENNAMKDCNILPVVDNTNISTSLDHIFSGDDYASIYYGYKWSEVLDADAFSAFEESNVGVFSKAIAEDFKNFILSKGDTEDPNKLYIRFRCKYPSIDALLQRNGIMTGGDTNHTTKNR